MPFSVRVSKGVPDKTAIIAKAVFKLLDKRANENVRVFVVNKRFVDQAALGSFEYKIYSNRLIKKYPILKDMRYPHISIAGLDRNDLSLIRTCLHEFAHYEQFRDGKKVQERGIRVRTRNIMTKLLAISNKHAQKQKETTP